MTDPSTKVLFSSRTKSFDNDTQQIVILRLQRRQPLSSQVAAWMCSPDRQTVGLFLGPKNYFNSTRKTRRQETFEICGHQLSQTTLQFPKLTNALFSYSD